MGGCGCVHACVFVCLHACGAHISATYLLRGSPETLQMKSNTFVLGTPKGVTVVPVLGFTSNMFLHRSYITFLHNSLPLYL